jgi:hypothetical protein
MDFDFTSETITPELTNVLTIGGTGALEVPFGTTGERPVSGLTNGALRFNTTLNVMEGYVNSSWSTVTTSNTATPLVLSGDVTGTGTTSAVTTTLATVNSNVGTFASVTVNGKGLVTGAAALTGDITTSGAVSTLATVNSNVGTFASVTVNGKGLVTAATALNGDATSSGATLTLATVNSSPQTDQFRKITVNGKGLVTATTAVSSSDITTALGYTPVNKAGDTMNSAANLTFSGGGTVTGLPTPTNGTDATNKNYVDSVVAGLSWKQAVRVATTANGTIATAFAAGQTIDGVTLVTGDRILIKNQATQTENGIYIVASSGAPTRSSDADTGTELLGATVFVDQGTVNATTGWTQTTDAPITIGSSNIVFVQFSGSGSYTAGTGLTLSGNQFSLTSPVVSTLGGTGQTAYAVGDLLSANTTTTLSRIAGVATGNALISGGLNTLPSWGKIGLTTHVSGTLPIANGGTNTTTTPSNGQLLIGNGSGYAVAALTQGAGITITNGAGSITVANAGVTTLAGTSNQITASASTGAVTLSTPATFIAPGSIASTTTITAGSTLAVTGNTANSFLYSGTAGLVTTTSAPTNGQILIGSTGAVPVAAAISPGTGISVTNGAGSITVANTGVVSISFGSTGLTPNTATTGAVTVAGTLGLTNGGTNASLTAVNGGVVYSTASAMAITAAGTAGQVLRSNGAAAPTWTSTSGILQLYKENPSSPTAPLVAGTNAVAIMSGSSASGTNAIAIGAGTSANVNNIFAYANGNFTTAGDAQDIKVVLRNSTTNATTTELFIDGSSQRLVLPNNSAWTFTIRVVGRRTDATGGWAMYTFTGGITRDANAASTVLRNSSRVIVNESTGALNCTITGDTTNGSLNINVTGIAAQTYRWVASAEIIQVTN